MNKMETDGQAIPPFEPNDKRAIFGIVCGAHFLNHFQSSMLGVLYPLMMRDLSIGFVAIGAITAIYGFVGNFLQAFYGFIVPYVRRGVILGAGNILLGLSVVATGFASSYPYLIVTRVLGGIGTSPQHPVGSTALASYFGKARARALAFHSTAANLGSLVAPIVAAVLITSIGWRGIFWIVGIPSILMGIACLALRDTIRLNPAQIRKSRLTPLGWDAYRRCLKDKNILLISLVLMVGGAGLGHGINDTYIVPHFINDLNVDVKYAAFLYTLIQVGGLLGPMAWGWISDRYHRTRTLQVSLLISALSTLWLSLQYSVSFGLFVNLVLYGAVVTSRQTLTQALLTDVADEEILDAAFSLYYCIGFIMSPFWTLFAGWLMEKSGFQLTFTVISCSYLLGMTLLLFFREPVKKFMPFRAEHAQ
jgi:FSR family fosmidomycin resistance protein-like MFS transporter